MMSVYDFCFLACDDSLECAIYDMNESVEGEIFRGTYAEAMESQWETEEVESFDVENGVVILNINT